MGRPLGGGTHHPAMMAGNPTGPGRQSRGMRRKDTPEGDRMTVLADKGYQGITWHYGMNPAVPEKKRRRKELTGAQKRGTSAGMTGAGHAIGRMKQRGTAVGPYDGTTERPGDGPMAATGLADPALL